MEEAAFSQLLTEFDKLRLYHELTKLHSQLEVQARSEDASIDYLTCLRQINEIIEKFNVPVKAKKSKDKEDPKADDISVQASGNLFRLISRILVLVFSKLPTKVYDVANNLLGHLILSSDGKLSVIADLAIIVLTDLFEVYPNSLGSLINFAVNQIYKILKKDPNVSGNLIYLLNSLSKYSTRNDIDDKLHAKLLKIVQKNITSLPVSFNYAAVNVDSLNISSVLLKKNYILVLKNLTILSLNSNYEHLLASSASSTTGAKMKPESIMSNQHTFQMTLLTSIEKQVFYGLANNCKDIRIATVELLAHTFLNFIPTGRFDAVEYLVGLYKLPSLNFWTEDLASLIVDGQEIDPKAEYSYTESEGMVQNDFDLTLLNVGIIETIIFYIQLEQFQNSEYLSTNLLQVITTVLRKFSIMEGKDNHVQNSAWVKVLNHWKTVLDYLIKESGLSSHEMLISYFLNYLEFTDKADVENNGSSKDKRASTIFSLKASKSSSKAKDFGTINMYYNSYQCSLLLSILELLLPFSIDFSSYIGGNEGGDEKPDGTRLESAEKSALVELLMRLLINKSEYIRNYSLKTLLKYAQINEIEANPLVLSSFELFNTELRILSESKQSEVVSNLDINSTSSVSVKLLSYALFLLALLKQTPPVNLQNATIVKILSFCTQNLKHNTSFSKLTNTKSIACWVILSSLVTLYNESEFVKLNSSQFVVFWKSLLTSQYIPSGLNGASEDGPEKEILENLKLRNSSLICLLNYIDTVSLTPESLKQIQFLLTKAYNYLTYLETNVDTIGAITNFESDSFNQESFNFNGASDLLFSNQGSSSKLLTKNYMITLILYSKKIIFKSLAKLAVFLKNDINSSMIVFLRKIFSDPKIFNNDKTDKSKTSKTKTYEKVKDFDTNLITLGHEIHNNFGVTSKFIESRTEIDSHEVEILSDPSFNGLLYVDTFAEHDEYSNSSISGRDIECRPWFEALEKTVFEVSPHSINYDAAYFLTSPYSKWSKFPVNLTTSLVDVSIDLFQLVFPYLTSKIQSSLLEELRTSITSKTVSPLRYKAICVNVSVAIYGVVKFAHSKKIVFEKPIIDGIIDLLKRVDLNSIPLIELNSESTGLANSFLATKDIAEQIDTYVSTIVNNTEPIIRGKALISMSRIYAYTGIGANDVFNVVHQLLNDPNPIVYHYSLRAASTLFENSIKNNSWISPLVNMLFESYINDSFGYDIANRNLLNLKFKFGSIELVSKLLMNFITALGPNLRSVPEQTRDELRSLLISLRYAIGSASIDDDVGLYSYLVRSLQELVIFDPKLIEDEVHFYSDLLVSLISKNLKIGLTTVSTTSLNSEAIFPFNSSFELYRLSYGCFGELVKVYGDAVLTKEVVQLVWVSLNIKPCPELKNLIRLWMESNLNMNWFATLNSLFKISLKKLAQPFIEVNYQQKLLPLLQRQKKKSDKSLNFKDEEIENIVAEDNENDDKNEPISWELKLFIYDLLNNLLTLAQKSQLLFDKLKFRISDLVKIAFLGSTSPINVIKLEGINLLDKVLALYGDLEDSMYSGVSILEQQQAQIISAIVPCFNNNKNSALVIVNGVNVSSKFINLPRIKFHSKQRILKTLIYLLEELASNKFVKFGFLESLSEHGKKSIQVSILNCWAVVRLNTYNFIKESSGATNESTDLEEIDTAPEQELIETLEKYSTLLIALWIVSLKEYITMKYNDVNSSELEIYNNYWINFISVLSLELDENNSFMEEHLGGDASAFFFILFSQCVESLIKNRNVDEVLVSLNSLVKHKELVDILFHDEIFAEVIDLFDRCILVDNSIDIQVKLINIISSLFQTYFSSHKGLAEGFDKLFELIRLSMLPLFNYLPFLRTDYDPQDQQTIQYLKKIDLAPHIIIIKTSMTKLSEMLPRFPDVVKVDLYSCLLFVFSKIYEFKNDLLISIILPFLREILSDSKTLNPKMNEDFNKIIRETYPLNESNSSILTYMILITADNIKLNEAESILMKDALINMVLNEETKLVGFHCIRSLSLNKDGLLVNKLIVKEAIKLILVEEIDPKVGIEILIVYIKNQPNTTKFYSVVIPILLRLSKNLNQFYLHERLITLINHDPESFKLVLNDTLNTEERQLAESLVKLNINSDAQDTDDSEIQLKTFG